MIYGKLESLTYSTDPTQGIRIAFGAFVFVIAIVPATIVAVQWLSRSDGPEPSMSPWSILPAAVIALWGLWQVTWRERVTIEPHDKTLIWSQSLGGVELKRIVWKWEDIGAIEVLNNNGGFKLQGYSAQVTGPRGTRELLSYLDSASVLPKELRETSRLLNRSIELPK